MYYIFFNIIIFIFIFVLGYISLTGIGKLTVNENYKLNNFFDLQIFGSINLLIVAYFINLTFGTNYIINIIIFLIGLYLYFFYKKKLNKIKLSTIITLLITIFSVILISKTHEDFETYHFFSIYEIFNNNIRFGVSNLNERFFHSSLLVFNQSLYVFPYLEFKLVHFPVIYIYISTIGFFFNNLDKEKTKGSLIFSIFCLIILIVKFNRLSEFGYDYISQFLILIIFYKFFFQKLNFEQLSIGIIFFIFAVLVRPISLFFLPFVLYALISNKLDFINYLIKNKVYMILILSIIMFSTSFFRTGCIFYPIHSTCFSSQKIIWSQKKFINDYSKIVELWAKGFYHQKGTKYDQMSDPEEFNKNFNWMKFWIEKHFFYKIFEFIIIVLVAYLISYIYFTKEKSKQKFQKNNLILLIMGIVSLYLWINFLPQFRFGFSLIIIFIFLLLRCISEIDIIYDKSKVIKLFLICFIFLNFKNINRINSEFKRDDFYKFTNFPFFNEPKLVFKYDDYKIEKLFHTQIIIKSK